MKSKILLLVGMFACVSAYGEMDYVDLQIQELEQRRDELQAELDVCEENTRKFKIAGVATLGATGVGIVGNIKLAQEIKKIEQSKSGGGGFVGGGSGGGVKVDTQSQEERDESSCREFEKLGIELPEECKK